MKINIWAKFSVFIFVLYKYLFKKYIVRLYVSDVELTINFI